MDFKPIGGEFWYDDLLISEKKSFPNAYFLNGGRTSIACICRYLKLNNIYKILLPNYLCPTILDVFDTEGLQYVFYEINESFSIDINSIKSNISLVDSIMFIDYFGLSLNKVEEEYLISLRAMGKVLIEDKVHSLREGFIGNLAFNSFRKILPISGSNLQTNINLSNILEGIGFNHNYEKQIKDARVKKTEFILDNNGEEDDYLVSFKSAENLYYKDYSIGSNLEKLRLEKVDFEGIKIMRNSNYKYLQKLLSDIKGINIIFEDINEKVPLGLPVYVEGDKRDFLLKRLKEKQIYLPIHWDLRNEERILDAKPRLISSQILTLVIDQRYDSNDMYRLATEIKRIIG